MDKVDVNALIARYGEVHDTGQVAEEFGLTRRGVRFYLAREGVPVNEGAATIAGVLSAVPLKYHITARVCADVVRLRKHIGRTRSWRSGRKSVDASTIVSTER